MKIWTESPLKRINTDALPPEKLKKERSLAMARNSCESFQIALRSEADFTIEKVEITGLKEIVCRYYFQEEIAFEDKSYQDPLSNEEMIEVKKNVTQSIWITVFVEKTVEAGKRKGEAKVITNQGSYEIDLTVQVYPVTIPDTKEGAFETEYWMNSVNFWFRYPSKDQLDFINYHYGCEKYSDAWWKINRAIADNMKENRINVLFVRTHDLLLDGGTILLEDGTYQFKWELFDQWIAFFDTYAQVKLFAGYHLVVQTEGKDVYIIDNVDGRPEIVISPIGSEKTENWLKQFLTALYEHLEEKGIKDRWLQHVEDEPSEPDSWKYARDQVRTYMPGIDCMDAIDRQSPMPPLQEQMDLWIPRVDVYEKNREFYDYRLGRGDRRWIYTCCEPTEQNYTNKFIDWPLLHNRVIAWGCFVNHFSGFLHWGYNFWDPEDKYFGLNPQAIIRGDGYIVYPDKERNGIKNSIRMISTRDGAQDYELLKLLADKNPEKAYRLARKVIARFNDFNWNVEEFEANRAKLLEELREKE